VDREPALPFSPRRLQGELLRNVCELGRGVHYERLEQDAIYGQACSEIRR
jgi:hypothetical protein